MNKNILETIDQVSKSHPNAVAFDYLGIQNTYQELSTWSGRMATAIKHLNLNKDVPVMVYGGQTFDMLVSFLGVAKSGHAYIPVDAHSSQQRLASIIETANPGLIISIEPFPLETKVPLLRLKELHEIYITSSNDTKKEELALNDNFYILFTSGTTGKPKGVQITHQNLLSFVEWMTQSFNFNRQNVLLQPSFSFDLSVMAIYPTLVCGGTLKVLPKKITDNFMSMFTLLPKLALNSWISTPSLIDICLVDPNFTAEAFPQLDTFLFCGEELSHATAEKLKQRFPLAHVYNTYGPTETTVAVTSVEITTDILKKYSRLPIGYVKSDTSIVIESEHNEKGELIIVGPSVSKGYLNNPEKTTAAFIDLNGHRAYKSGDLGYYSDKLLFYSGRTDFQIKLNGYRIELEEINHYLSQLSLIKQGVVVPKYDNRGKVLQLIGIVSPKQSTDNTLAYTNQIKDALGKLVMPYMIPQRFSFRDKLPLSANGKIDVKTLITEVNGHD
ncbi:D-alanine--poly(phosphoribitol) ligase subunit DltA [Secundilactobacillus hailunensis]|uniref:D-alanine--D-alanyl carrier protein ligase n=1 Tax=Secundilactobacillus hailunensis TaxID=2559923 RepID=A0ABW1TAL9_9LACO|nr:D-alanine--poly(phosphoribitol) ligase subunit DltA [Secundilactobacillus hailunensis]